MPMDAPTFGESVSDAMRFWELRRLAYNAVLSVMVLFYFFRAYPASRAILTLDSILGLFLFAVLANVVYCAAYLADVLLSGPRIAICRRHVVRGNTHSLYRHWNVLAISPVENSFGGLFF
jgi:hypothetical protein